MQAGVAECYAHEDADKQDTTDNALTKKSTLGVARVVSVVSCLVRVFMNVDASHGNRAPH